MDHTRATAMPGARGADFERTRYFSRMVVSPEDLTRDQNYHIAKRRYWTRLLHGWGIARGLELELVEGEDGRPLLAITAGDALARDGAEITLARKATVDPKSEDGDGNARVVDGDLATPAGSSTAARRDAGATYLVAVRRREIPSRQVRAPLGPGPDGSTCEATVLRDACAFRLFANGHATTAELSERGWVVLGAIADFGRDGQAIETTPRQDFPLDSDESPADPPGEPGDVIAALNAGEPERAEKHLAAWKGGIERGLRTLLKPAAIARLVEIGPLGHLGQIPARLLADCPGDPDGARNLLRFYDRAKSPYDESSQVTLLCLARLSREEFAERVRLIFPRDEISDGVVRHAHRSAALVYALVKQWPAPTFRELISEP